MPPLIIQPLVENAVKHGLSCQEKGGKVWVLASLEDGELRIQVRDNGIGMPKSAIAHVYNRNGADQSNLSMALRNINQRLEHIYGPSYSVRIKSAELKGTTITIVIPLAKDLTN